MGSVNEPPTWTPNRPPSEPAPERDHVEVDQRFLVDFGDDRVTVVRDRKGRTYNVLEREVSVRTGAISDRQPNADLRPGNVIEGHTCCACFEGGDAAGEAGFGRGVVEPVITDRVPVPVSTDLRPVELVRCHAIPSTEQPGSFST